MLVHSVYFWLKSDLSDSERGDFAAGLETLKEIPAAEAVYVGTPSTTDRPVIDNSYDFALTLIFRDMDAHDAYQVDPRHKSFLETFKPMFEKVLIYDAD